MLDEIRHGGQVSQDAEGTQVGVMVFARGDGDACHIGIIDAELGIGNRELVLGWGGCIMLGVKDIGS